MKEIDLDALAKELWSTRPMKVWNRNIQEFEPLALENIDPEIREGVYELSKKVAILLLEARIDSISYYLGYDHIVDNIVRKDALTQITELTSQLEELKGRK